MNSLIAIGLIYDIVGVVIVALALLGGSKQALYVQSGSHYFLDNRDLFRALLIQRVDAQFGMPVLVSGFCFQLAGASIPNVSPNWILVVSILLAIWLCVYVTVRHNTKIESEETFDRIRKELEGE